MQAKRKAKRTFGAALLCAALCLASFPIHAQNDGKKTILEQLREAPTLKEEADARYRKLQEEREAKLREWAKLPPEQREELECKEIEEATKLTIRCRSHYLRQGYKDMWGGTEGLDVRFIIMEGPDGAVFCAVGFDAGRPVSCMPLKRVE